MNQIVKSTLTRRDFVVASATVTSGLAITVMLPSFAEAATIGAQPFGPDASPHDINAFLAIEPDGSILIRSPHNEMGQGAITALPMIVAEELECDWAKVKVEYASAMRNLREHRVYGDMVTAGSRGVRTSWRMLQQAGASAREDRMPIAFDARIAVGSIQRSIGISEVPSGVEPQAVEGIANTNYLIPNLRVGVMLKNTHIPVGFWRSVGSSQNAFFMDSYVDELAYAAGQDPYKFRRALLMHRPDFIGVLDKIAEKGHWGKPLAARRGRGIAIHECYGTIVGQVAEVTVTQKGEVKVERVVAAVDCGHVVNPSIVEAQIESGIIYGLSAALYGDLTIKDGRVQQVNFDEYKMVQLADAPEIEVYLALSGGKKWGGIGEPGTAPIAPAVANAVFAATGRRVRMLPLKNARLSDAA